VKRVEGASGCGAQVGFELGECHFDRVQIGRILREEQDSRAACADRRLGGVGALVDGKIVENDNVAGLQYRRELGFDIAVERVAIHRTREHPRGGEALVTLGCDEGLRAAAAERRLHVQPPTAQGAPTQARHSCRDRGLIEEHQPAEPLA
jgi:hypothetical protein